MRSFPAANRSPKARDLGRLGLVFAVAFVVGVLFHVFQFVR